MRRFVCLVLAFMFALSIPCTGSAALRTDFSVNSQKVARHGTGISEFAERVTPDSEFYHLELIMNWSTLWSGAFNPRDPVFYEFHKVRLMLPKHSLDLKAYFISSEQLRKLEFVHHRYEKRWNAIHHEEIWGKLGIPRSWTLEAFVRLLSAPASHHRK